MYLRVGDRIPADGRVVKLKTITFNADEASLTGESVTSSKTPGALTQAQVIADKVNMVFSSTMVTNGGCYVVVTNTGQRTEIGAVNAGVKLLLKKSSCEDALGAEARRFQ